MGGVFKGDNQFVVYLDGSRNSIDIGFRIFDSDTGSIIDGSNVKALMEYFYDITHESTLAIQEVTSLQSSDGYVILRMNLPIMWANSVIVISFSIYDTNKGVLSKKYIDVIYTNKYTSTLNELTQFVIKSLNDYGETDIPNLIYNPVSSQLSSRPILTI